jgi:hypothetical protein
MIAVTLANDPLSGAPSDRRELTLHAPDGGSLDVTIAFEISPEGGDLAGRDRIHLLLRAA